MPAVWRATRPQYAAVVTTDAQQSRPLPRSFADQYALRAGEAVFALRIEPDRILFVRNWQVVSPIPDLVLDTVVSGDEIGVRLGEAAAEDFADASAEAIFAGLLVAAATGHPDEQEAERGVRPRLIWNPHMAVASGQDPGSARTKSKIARPSGRLQSSLSAQPELVDRSAAYRDTRRR